MSFNITSKNVMQYHLKKCHSKLVGKCLPFILFNL